MLIIQLYLADWNEAGWFIEGAQHVGSPKHKELITVVSITSILVLKMCS